ILADAHSAEMALSPSFPSCYRLINQPEPVMCNTFPACDTLSHCRRFTLRSAVLRPVGNMADDYRRFLTFSSKFISAAAGPINQTPEVRPLQVHPACFR
ncbi:MAG TPA: hypothetical protein V6C69_07430, partial [Trichormus sp.]